MPKKTCTITAIFADGYRHTITREARSLNNAVFEYICATIGNGNNRPTEPETVFEVQPQGGNLLRTTKARAMAAANRQSAATAGASVAPVGGRKMEPSR